MGNKKETYYELLPGVICFTHNGKQFYIDVNDLLLFLINKEVIQYKDVWPRWSDRVNKLWSKKSNNIYWEIGQYNTEELLGHLKNYVKENTAFIKISTLNEA